MGKLIQITTRVLRTCDTRLLHVFDEARGNQKARPHKLARLVRESFIAIFTGEQTSLALVKLRWSASVLFAYNTRIT